MGHSETEQGCGIPRYYVLAKPHFITFVYG